jgi:hypothetical protein
MNLDELKKLAGVQVHNTSLGKQTSQHGSDLHKQEREKGIKPGDPEWFQLWFARPYLTHEQPPGFRGRKR